jgi:hypothetical protein
MAAYTPDLAIVVMSCDRYSDLWEPFFELFFRHWPSCSCPVYLVGNERRSPHPRVTILNAGPDEGWSATLKRCLVQVPEQNVFTLIDDAFLVRAIDTARFLRLYEWFVAVGANYLRLRPSPKPDRRIDAEVGEIFPGSMYRTSAVFAFWRRQVLVDLLDDHENPWEFELEGVRRADALGGFYSVYRSAFPYMHGVDRGRWFPWAVVRLRNAGVAVDLAARPVMPLSSAARFAIGMPKAWVMSRVPNAVRVALIRSKRALVNRRKHRT